MLKMVDGTGIIGVDMVCPLGGTVSPPQPPNYDKVEVEGVGSLMLPNSLEAPVERVELIGNSVQPTTTGKNLFDESKAVTGRINPDNGVLLPETSYTASDYIEVQEGETYFQTGSKESYYRAFYDADKKFTSIPLKGSIQITVPVGSKFLRVSGKEDINNWQIEKGVKVTPYEPYTGGKPSPSPEYPQEIRSVGKFDETSGKYLLDVKVTGKNLLDIKDITSETPQWLEIPCLIKNNIYIKSNNSTVLVENNQARLIVCFKDGTSRAVYDNSMADGLPFKVNSENPITTIKVRGTHIKSGVYSEIQVEYGNEPTPYEPYTEQTLTLTSDRPITKWDKLVEQGGEYGWLYSGKIAKEFTFVSKASDENISGRIRRRFKTSLNGKFPQTDKVMCNFLTTDNVRNDYSIGIVGSGDIYIYFYENTGVETLEQANHWLKNLPFEKTIIFERKTTEFVPLSESEQTQLRSLHSYNGTTHITVDSGEVPCEIKLTYRKEK